MLDLLYLVYQELKRISGERERHDIHTEREREKVRQNNVTNGGAIHVERESFVTHLVDQSWQTHSPLNLTQPHH